MSTEPRRPPEAAGPWGSVRLAEPSPHSSPEASQQSTVFVLQQDIYLCPGCSFLEDLSLVSPFSPVSLSFFLHWLLIHAFIHSFHRYFSRPPVHRAPPTSAAQCLGCSPYAAPSCVFLHHAPRQPCIAIPCPVTPPVPVHSMPVLQCLAMGLAMPPLIP